MNRDKSIIGKASRYVVALMEDGREHSMGEVLAYATQRFSDDGMDIGATTVKRSVEHALEDKTRYVWLRYGRYQYKPGYLQNHDLADYARERISAALRKATREIRNCRDSDLAGAESDTSTGIVLCTADSILDTLGKCESALEARGIGVPEAAQEENLSVRETLTAAREEQHRAKGRGDSLSGKPKAGRKISRER